ncbi:DNA cross-link repair 1A protein [Pteropus alecto]|uniref:DNA cross-link repair 1A protein n=1 Tax=Pteropus alecto TaxID=9402 RepID=L5K979_PTEAL|nr:DNA cross-link repair 1A protein [Pteropus alecto]
MVNAVGVVLRDASSCPGAVMILFNLPNGDVTLRTGDFQADPTKSTCFNLAVIISSTHSKDSLEEPMELCLRAD